MPNQKKTKKDMLSELESIKGLLLLDEVDIPVLEEVIEGDDNAISASHQVELEPKVTEKLTVEQTLNTEKSRTQEFPQLETEENPFLPKHIRSRLRGNQSSNIADDATNTDPTHITNLLVASIMPQLERLLRQRLATLTKEQIDTLLNIPAKRK